MRFSLWLALRHLRSQPRGSVVGVIARVATVGVAMGSMALMVVLSVFNGIETLVGGMYSILDTDFEVVPREGKVIRLTEAQLAQLRSLPSGSRYGLVLEENALFGYGDRQHIGVMMGVDSGYWVLNHMEGFCSTGRGLLWYGSQPLALPGMGVAYYLGANPEHYEPLTVYIPNRLAQNWLNPLTAFREKRYAFQGLLQVNSEFDDKTVLLPLSEAQMLLAYDSLTVTSVAVNAPANELDAVQKLLEKAFSPSGEVLGRYQQNASLYRTMRSERLMIVLILTLILVVAAFNVVGSLAMLIIQKRDEVVTLAYLGAPTMKIRQIFLFEGLAISLVGGLLGVLLGLVLCWLQATFGIISLGASGSFVVDAYPVEVHALDVLLVMGLVVVIGLLAAWIPTLVLNYRNSTAQ